MKYLKTILLILVLAVAYMTVCGMYGHFRLEIIRWTMDRKLPEWMLWVLWGWI